jgi:single-strand DNA-binding protein
MAGDTTITLIGNLVEDPELRFTPSGAAVAKFRMDSLYLSCNVWRQAAENVAESLQKGMRVIVSGRLRQRSYETREGEKRTVYEVEVDEVGPSLRNASAKVTKAMRGGGSGGGNAFSGGSPADDPWATQPSGGAGSASDDPPF